MRKATTAFIWIGLLIAAAYDVFAIAKGGVESSISHLIIEWSYKYPIFTYMAGVIAGHLFWRMGDTKRTKELDINPDD